MLIVGLGRKGRKRAPSPASCCRLQDVTSSHQLPRGCSAGPGPRAWSRPLHQGARLKDLPARGPPGSHVGGCRSCFADESGTDVQLCVLGPEGPGGALVPPTAPEADRPRWGSVIGAKPAYGDCRALNGTGGLRAFPKPDLQPPWGSLRSLSLLHGTALVIRDSAFPLLKQPLPLCAGITSSGCPEAAPAAAQRLFKKVWLLPSLE